MTDSLFEENGNATLTFNLANGQFQLDEDTGDPVPVEGVLEVVAKMKRPTFRPLQSEQAGNDLSEVVLEGRAVDPMYLPSSIKVGAIAHCIMEDLFTGNKQVGQFVVTDLLQSSFSQVTEIMGSRFKGVFKVDNIGGTLYG